MCLIDDVYHITPYEDQSKIIALFCFTIGCFYLALVGIVRLALGPVRIKLIISGWYYGRNSCAENLGGN